MRAHSRPIGDVPAVSRYLACRGLLDAARQIDPLVLGAHAGLPFGDRDRPALVAALYTEPGIMTGISVLYLHDDGSALVDRDGKKVRRIFGGLRGLRGGSVRLAPADAHVTLAEGLEDAVATPILWPAFAPCWATCSTSGMQRVVLPRSIRHVTIVADRDRSGAGEAAARNAAARLRGEGRDVQIYLPEPPAKDAADILVSRSRGAA